jgi:hypothetical protein
MADESKTEKKILTYKEYEKIIQRELDDYNHMMKEFEEQYIDFYKIKEYLTISPLSYVDYCSVNNFDMEYNDEDIKSLY